MSEKNMIECTNCNFRSKVTNTLSQQELQALSRSCLSVNAVGREKILREGAPATHVIYLKSGLAKIHKTGPQREDQILKIVMPGNYIGIQTLFTKKSNLYSATTLEGSTLCYIDFNFFREMIRTNPRFAYELIALISDDELGYFERMINHSQKQSSGRLADTLLFFANDVYHSDSFTLPLSRNDLSAIICSSRETAIRTLSDFHKSEIILLDGKHVTILDREKLAKISKKG